MIPEHAQIMDIAGPAQVFASAAERGAQYEVHFYSEADYSTTHQGLTFVSGSSTPTLDAIDLLIVPGWKTEKTMAPYGDKATSLIKKHWEIGGRIASVCAGSLMLAKLGILDGKKATTHHELLEELAKFPNVEAVKDVLYTCNDSVYTSAGIASGIDLSLHIVAEDCGPALAAQVARTLVVPAWRPGASSQVSVMLKHRNHMDDVVHRAQDILDNFQEEVPSLKHLADDLGVSDRTLTRHFVKAIGMTPFAYGDAIRRERVQRLRSNGWSAEEAAHSVGFADARSLRKR